MQLGEIITEVSQLLHRHMVCDVFCLLMKLSLTLMFSAQPYSNILNLFKVAAIARDKRKLASPP